MGCFCFAIWRNGRMEALAVAPGVPSPFTSKNSVTRVPAGLYQVLEDSGNLFTVPGKRDPEPTHLSSSRSEALGSKPAVITCDRFQPSCSK